MQKRTLRASNGLVAALLALALIGGCTPAHFSPGGNPAATSPTTSAQQFVTITGQAMVAGKPLANATVQVFDALSGAPMQIAPAAGNVISAGAGNVISAGAGNYHVAQAATVTTDANGNFALRLQVLVAAQVKKQYYQTVASKNGESVAALVTANAGNQNQELNAQVNETTTALLQLAKPMLAVLSTLKPDAAAAIEDKLLQNISDMAGTLSSALANSPAEAQELVTKTGQNGDTTDPSILNTIFKDAKLTSSVDSTLTTMLTSVAQVAQDKSNIVQAVNLTGTNFVGSDLQISVNGSKLALTQNGVTTNIDLTPGVPTGTQGNSGTGTGTTGNNGTTINLNMPTTGVDNASGTGSTMTTASGTIITSSSFNPTVTITKNASSQLTVAVTQTNEKVAVVYARIPKSSATLNSSLGSTLATGSATAGGTTTSLTVTGSAGSSSPTVVLPVWLGNTTVSGGLWHGTVKTGGGTTMANFDVYADGTYYYLVTTYTVNTATSVTSGISSTLTTTSGLFSTLNSCSIDYTLTSVLANEADGSAKI